MNLGKRFWWLCVVLPIAFYIGHMAVVVALRPHEPHWYVSEVAPHELGAAALFLAAGVAAACLFVRFGRTMPHGLRWVWLAYAAVALFVGLEEISYGQHLFGWTSPEYFARVNIQHETNLHNLGGQGPQRTMRAVGEFLIPIWCLLFPALFPRLSKEVYKPGHWSRYLVPRWELAVTVVLAVTLRPLHKRLPEIFGDKATKEFMEFLWAWAALLLVYVVWVRLRSPRRQLAVA